MKHSLTILIILFITVSAQAITIPFKVTIDTTRVVNNSEIYTVTQNVTTTYFTMSSSDPKTMMSMLGQGVVIYFDVKGKKKRNVSVTYPLVDKQPRSRPEEGSNGDVQVRSLQDEKDFNVRIAEMLEKEAPQNAKYTYYKDDDTFNVLMNKHQIEAVFNFNEESGILTYSLAIPTVKINDDPTTDFSKMTIGVKSPERTTEDRPEASNNGQSNRGGGGGGQRGGGQGGQRGNGEQGGNQGDSRTSFNFWFDANLN